MSCRDGSGRSADSLTGTEPRRDRRNRCEASAGPDGDARTPGGQVPATTRCARVSLRGAAEVRQRPGRQQGSAHRVLRPLCPLPAVDAVHDRPGLRPAQQRPTAKGPRRQRSRELPDHRPSAAIAGPRPDRERLGRRRRQPAPLVRCHRPRTGNPERNEQGVEHPLRSLAVPPHALSPRGRRPRPARRLDHWIDGADGLRDPDCTRGGIHRIVVGRFSRLELRAHSHRVHGDDSREVHVA